MEKKNIYILAAVILVSVLVFSYSYFFSSPQVASFLDIQKEANSAFNAGNIDKAASLIEGSIANAPDKESEANAKMLLGFVYFKKDFEKATGIFKEISSNGQYSASIRAQALTNMADYFMIGERKNGALSNAIFSGDPFSKYILEKDGTKNLLVGIRNLYEASTDTYSLPFAEYRIAEWYAKQAVRSGLYKESLSKSADFYIKKSEEYLLKGDSAMGSQAKMSSTEKGYSKWLKGEVLGMLSILKKNEQYKSSAEDSFKSSLTDLDSALGTVYGDSHEMWAKFAYASFLNNAYGSSRSRDITALTTFIASPANRTVRSGSTREVGLVRYLRSIGEMKAVSGHAKVDYMNAVGLSKVDLNFKSFLNELGWKLK